MHTESCPLSAARPLPRLALRSRFTPTVAASRPEAAAVRVTGRSRSPEPRAPPARVVPNLPEALGSVGRCPPPRTRRGRATPLSVRKPRASAGLGRAGAAAPRRAGSWGGRRHGDGAARGSVTPRARDSCAARRVVAARRRQATGVLQRPCSPRDVSRAGDPSTTEAASSCAGGGRSAPCWRSLPRESRPGQIGGSSPAGPAPAVLAASLRLEGKERVPKTPAVVPAPRREAAGPGPAGSCSSVGRRSCPLRNVCPGGVPPPSPTASRDLSREPRWPPQARFPPLFCLRYALSK